MKTAIFSDIHGNSPALRAVLDDISRQGCTRAFMLGDLINGMDPQGCVDTLFEWSQSNSIELASIKGNAEAYLATPDLDLIPNRGEEWQQDMYNLIHWYKSRLTFEAQAWLVSLPDSLLVDGWCLVHDNPLDRFSTRWHNPEIPLQYQEWFFHAKGVSGRTSETEWQEIADFMVDRSFSHIFCGHTHECFTREIDDKIICNVGSVGAPLDHDYRPSWVLLEDGALFLHRVDYDVALIHALIDRTPDYPSFVFPGLQQAFKRWMSTGIHWRAHLPKEQ